MSNLPKIRLRIAITLYHPIIPEQKVWPTVSFHTLLICCSSNYSSQIFCHFQARSFNRLEEIASTLSLHLIHKDYCVCAAVNNKNLTIPCSYYETKLTFVSLWSSIMRKIWWRNWQFSCLYWNKRLYFRPFIHSHVDNLLITNNKHIFVCVCVCMKVKHHFSSNTWQERKRHGAKYEQESELSRIVWYLLGCEWLLFMCDVHKRQKKVTWNVSSVETMFISNFEI